MIKVRKGREGEIRKEKERDKECQEKPNLKCEYEGAGAWAKRRAKAQRNGTESAKRPGKKNL